MSFLKKHYEKVILAILLLLFVILLILQVVSVMSEKAKNPEAALNIQPPMADYKRLDFKKNYMDLPQAARLQTISGPSKARQHSCVRENRETGEEPKVKWVVADYFSPPELVLCPIPGGTARHLIPAEDLKKEKTVAGKRGFFCSYCGKEIVLRNASGEAVSFTAGGIDSDGDGIPDRDETRLGLNPNDKSDGELDKDSDGFSNKEEILARTDINNPKSRPTYAKKLYVQSILRQKLGMRLLQFTDAGENIDTRKWGVQITVFSWNRRRKRLKKDTKFLKLGDSFKFQPSEFSPVLEYTLSSIEKSFQYNEQSKALENKSRLILMCKGQTTPIVAEPGKDVVDPRQKIIFYLHVAFEHSKDISSYVGESFTVGDSVRGVDKFTVLSVNVENNTARIRSMSKGGKRYEIKSFKSIEHELNALPQSMPSGGFPPGATPPGLPPGAAPSGGAPF